MSNRLGIDDEKYWNDSKIKGFGFGEDTESIEEDNIFYGVSQERDAATKVGQDLRAEVSSLSSFVSDESSEEIHESFQRLRDLPPFLWNSGPLELELDRPVSGALNPEAYMHREQGDTRPLHLPSMDETIHQLLNSNEHVLLEHYQSLSQKKQLLTRAIEIHDGNAILAVTLFLYKTLKHSIFRQMLIEHKAAANHYVRYLETKNEVNHLVDLLNMLGRTKEAMLIRYKHILRRENNLQNFLKEMEHFYHSECQLSNEEVALLFNQHLQLLYIYKEIKEKTSFIHTDNSSVLKTLNFVAENFYENTNPPLTADNIKQKFNLNVKQYNWVVLKALVVQQKWPQIEALLLTKTWLGSSKDRCLLPLEEVCNTLKDGDAPIDLVARFVRLIDDTEKKLVIARKLNCHSVVIDVYAAQKDRAAILTYKSNLEDNSKEFVYAETILKHNAIKWKN
ncbi:spermatogenesis-defective protein 39 homolog [Folsomia candida]|uniref:Spermatogenesis-defective protein 39 n=1 Tax=Folsomia candida TaxID=158441 RepID=A0A226EP84_FOLCA|nr:spermatogenesis-defective protein 39 homolog [Folsomia candida]OXA59443.1 Spermatogenesis-defective protein 39 [Folsomia candida]